MAIVPCGAHGLNYWEFVHAAARYRRSGFRPEHDAVARIRPRFAIELQAVVETRNIHFRHKTVVQRSTQTVKPLCDRTRMVEPVAELLHLPAQRQRRGIELFVDFVSDRPHHDGWMVPTEPDKHLKILAPPIVEKEVVAIPAFRLTPLVEGLGHDHHAFLVAYGELQSARHIVGCTDGIAPHRLQQTYLATECSLVERGSERSQIMMETHPLELALDAVQPKASIGP